MILLVAGPMIVDATAGILQIWASSLTLRLATGIIWSIFLPFFWFQALDQLYQPDHDKN